MSAASASTSPRELIRTPDQRLRVFVSSTLNELAAARASARRAIEALRLTPVMFELAARPHPPRSLYRAYLAQSDVFVGIYADSYGWVAPGEDVSGLEDEYRLSAGMPRLLYVKEPAVDRDLRLEALLERIRLDDDVSYRVFHAEDELERFVAEDLAVLMSERFTATSETPPARKPDAPMPSGHLPVPITSFVGRDEEATALHDTVRAHRLVTVVGPGGTGKTRLALRVASELADDFPNGVFFVDLAPVVDPAVVPAAVAQALGLREQAHVSFAETVETALAGHAALLVLDNFEHVVAAGPFVTDLLAAAADVHVIVTSRAPLHVSGERLFPLAPMALPDRNDASDLDRLARTDAVALFVERARDVSPGFALTSRTAPLVAEIARRVDGLPLAIELAASRLRILSLEQIAERLERRLDLLAGGPVDLPGRQRTLKATIDWSYDLLASDEREFFARLAVFAGGFTIEAAESVAGDVGRGGTDVLGLVGALVDASLVQPVDVTGAGGRFGMLETVREYGLDVLEQSSEAGETRERHANHFLRLAERAVGEMAGPSQPEWLSRLSDDADNLRAALAWTVGRDDAERALRLAAALRPYWSLGGAFREGRDWIDTVLGLPGADAPTRDRARVLAAGADLAAWQGDPVNLDLAHEAVAIFREIEDIPGLVDALEEVGTALLQIGDHEGAHDVFEEARVLRSEHGEPTADALHGLGFAAVLAGDLGTARPHLLDARGQYEQMHDVFWTAFAERWLGHLDRLEGRLAGARRWYRSSAGRLADVGSDFGIAMIVDAFADLALAEGDLERAVRLAGAASRLKEAVGRFDAFEAFGLEDPRFAAREVLGDAAVDGLWEQGRALSADAALDLATA